MKMCKVYRLCILPRYVSDTETLENTHTKNPYLKDYNSMSLIIYYMYDHDLIHLFHCTMFQCLKLWTILCANKKNFILQLPCLYMLIQSYIKTSRQFNDCKWQTNKKEKKRLFAIKKSVKINFTIISYWWIFPIRSGI